MSVIGPSEALRRGTEDFLVRLGQRSGDVEERRARGREIAPPSPPACEVVPVDAGGVPGEWVSVPGAVDAPIVVCLHHGGYVSGAAAALRPFEASLSARCGFRFLGLDYRLAPEHRFPAAIDDVVTAYRWLLDSGHDPARLAVGGASAGGGLAIGALIALRDAGVPLPAASFAVSPWADMTLTSPTMVAEESPDPLAGLAEFRQLVAAVLGDGDPRSPLASPALGDLAGLPPLHVEVGTAERLLDDARALVAGARRDGVAASLVEVEGGIHCFPLHVPDAPESVSALDRIADHLATCLA